MLMRWTLAGTLSVFAVQVSGMPQSVQTVRDRDALGAYSAWHDVPVQLIGQNAGDTVVRTIQAKGVYYGSPTVGLELNVVDDPFTKVSYVNFGQQSFYISNTDDMLACIAGGGYLTVRGSVFKMPTPPDGGREVVARFVSEVGDEQMLAARNGGYQIDLRPGVPHAFWTQLGGLDASIGIPTIDRMSVAGSRLQLDLIGGGRSRGTFSIDLERRQLLESVVDGKEVFAAN